MTTRKRFKRLVRARAAKTGESYTTALRHFRDHTSGERGMPPNQEESLWIHCSFCGKRKDEVQKIIAGPGVFICDECVRLCWEIVSPAEPDEKPAMDQGSARPEPAAPPAPPDPDLVARVRQHIEERLAQLAGDEAGVALLTSVEVTATSDGLRVDIVTARPGVLIGPGGSTVAELRSELAAVVGRRVALNIVPSAEE